MISRITLGLAAALLASSAFAHGDDNPDLGKGLKPPPFAVLQLDEVRNATARFIDVAPAEKEGYHDIGLFVPHMGWHYMKDRFVDGRFDPVHPELLVYADDPCGGPRKLVAVEYAAPFSESKHAPSGFVGNADQWDANQDFKLWTLHAWLFEYNATGVFNPNKPRIPWRKMLAAASVAGERRDGDEYGGGGEHFPPHARVVILAIGHGCSAIRRNVRGVVAQIERQVEPFQHILPEMSGVPAGSGAILRIYRQVAQFLRAQSQARQHQHPGRYG